MRRVEPDAALADVTRPGFDQWVVGAARGEAALLDPAPKARVYRQAGSRGSGATSARANGS